MWPGVRSYESMPVPLKARSAFIVVIIGQYCNSCYEERESSNRVPGFPVAMNPVALSWVESRTEGKSMVASRSRREYTHTHIYMGLNEKLNVNEARKIRKFRTKFRSSIIIRRDEIRREKPFLPFVSVDQRILEGVRRSEPRGYCATSTARGMIVTRGRKRKVDLRTKRERERKRPLPLRVCTTTPLSPSSLLPLPPPPPRNNTQLSQLPQKPTERVLVPSPMEALGMNHSQFLSTTLCIDG